jgi:hypothetical protein
MPNGNNQNWKEFRKLEEDVNEMDNVRLFFGTGNVNM